jgi:TonB-linked SusC/RagA family outer membrane protein
MTVVLMALCGSSAWAQARRIAGIVTSEGGEPLGNASVNVLGTALGTYTAESGHFTIPAPEGTITLRVRRIGYVQKTVSVAPGAAEVRILLAKDVLQLEKQVITGTATTIASQNAANSVATVSGEQLNRAPTPTVENALQGKIAGAIIRTNSGAPGGGSQVQLRGVTSIGSNSSPLYVIDGVPVSNDAIQSGLTTITQASRVIGTSNQDQQVNRIADINPADIDDISVLKGASAGAIYGSRASNGVILITTKRGRSGRPNFNITQRLGQFSLANKLDIRCFTSQAEADAANFKATPFTGECNDFQEQFYGEKDLSYETNLTVSGGSSGTTYFASGLVKRDAGIEQGTGYNKQALRVNLGQLIGSRLNIKANTNLIHSLTIRGVSGNDNANVNPFTVFSATPSFYGLAPVDGAYPRNPYLGANGDNPFQDRDLLHTPENVYRLIGGASANYSLLSSVRQSLDLVASGGVDQFTQIDKIVSPRYLYFEPADGLAGTVVNRNSNELEATLGASVIHKFFPSSQLFSSTTSIGFNQSRREFGSVFTAGQNLFLNQIDLDKATNITAFETNTLVKAFSYYAQEELLLFRERLLLTGGMNWERTSNNGDPDKFFTYPKLAASLRVPSYTRFIDNLKLRVAFGRAGNQPGYGQKFTSLTVSAEDGLSGTVPSTAYGNDQIKPERSTEIEGGFDMTFLSGRGSLDFTAYKKTIDDLILTAIVAPTTGFSSQVINGGQLVNRGYEIGLDLTPLQTRNLTWVSRTTFAHVHGIITKLPVPAFNTGGFGIGFGASRIEVGKSPSALIARDGYDTTFVNGVRGSTGCPKGAPDASCGAFVSRAVHLGIVGDQTPKFNMGFTNDLNFGPIRLSSMLEWRHAFTVANLTNNYFDSSHLFADTAASTRRLAMAGVTQRNSRAYLNETSFVKLRELSLSYQVPNGIVTRLFSQARDVRLELSGRNLKTWTDYTGLDPEVSNNGNTNLNNFNDITPYPPTRSFFFSISANF